MSRVLSRPVRGFSRYHVSAGFEYFLIEANHFQPFLHEGVCCFQVPLFGCFALLYSVQGGEHHMCETKYLSGAIWL